MLAKIFEQYPFDKSDILVDVGCGKGRVLIVALDYGCEKAYGIEINEKVYIELIQNISKYNGKICAILDNAEKTVGISVFGTKYFFFNPFEITVLRRVLNNIILNQKNFVFFFYAPFESTIELLNTYSQIHLDKVIENEGYDTLKVYVYISDYYLKL